MATKKQTQKTATPAPATETPKAVTVKTPAEILANADALAAADQVLAKTRKKVGPGVIDTVKATLALQPVTKREILAVLIATFPDRKPEGMHTTVGCQLGRIEGIEKGKNKDGAVTYHLPQK